MTHIAVGDVMTRNPVSVSPYANLLDCAKALVKHRVDSIIVVDGKRLLGILTARDILWTITKKPGIDLKSINVMTIATKKVAVTKPSADINEALTKMKALNFRRLPVISKGEVAGIVTLKDILKIDPSLYSQSGELIMIKEEEQKLSKSKTDWPLEGFCEQCGAFAELLSVENVLLCADCRDEMN